MSIVNRQHAIERLEPAIAALHNLTAESLGYSPDLIEQCVGLAFWLKNTLDNINGVEIEEAEGDIERRILVAEVGLRIASLAGEIEHEQKLLLETIETHEDQANALKWEGHKLADIEKLAPYPSERVNAIKLNIIDLMAEQEKLQAFFDNPDDASVSVLIGTSFEQIQE